MTLAWVLLRHVALWAATFPLLGVAGALLEGVFAPALATTQWPAAVAWALMLAWATWIYMRYVPRQGPPIARAAVLAVYIVAMGAVAYAALAVAMVLVAVTYGV